MTQAVPGSPASAAVAPRPALHVERLEGLALCGWLFNPAQPGAERLSLRCGGQDLPLPEWRRVRRPDVTQALGLPDTLVLGFECELPEAIWAAQASSAPLGWWLDGQPLGPARLDLQAGAAVAWLVRQLWQGEAARVSRRRSAWGRHLAECLGRCPDPGAALAAMQPRPAGVDGLDGLKILGWALDLPQRPARIELQVDEHVLACAVQRVDREDVAAHLLWPQPRLGFAIELPGSLWRLPAGPGALALQVLVDGQPVGAPLALRVEALAGLFARSRLLADARERQEQGLLAIEHLVDAQRLDDLDAAGRQQAHALLREVGLGAWLEAPDAVPLPAWKDRGISPRAARWLARPWAGRLACAALQASRRLPGLGSWSSGLEIGLTRALGLFDTVLYEQQVPAAQRGGRTALRHYVELGDAQSLLPHRLFDPRHYVGQLPGRRHPGINRLLHYGLVGRHQGLSISAWFDAGHYLRCSPDVQVSGIDPLRHFCRVGWTEGREAVPGYGERAGLSQPLRQRLARQAATAAFDPMTATVLRRLPAGAPMPEQGALPWAVPTRLDGRDFLDPAPWAALARRPTAPEGAAVVDVIVPVYAGSQESLRCLWAVLTAPVQAAHELVVIDDASPEPALSAMLARLAGLGLITLLVNAENLGFVRSVNRGLALHPARDVVLLNADTWVHGDWLDRLLAYPRRDPQVASVTPLSNNATIFSYPRSRLPNGAGSGPLRLDAAVLDAGLAAMGPPAEPVEVPTGVGFCMLMQRACLVQVGLLDAERFGRGYGEENDWCLRASARGWRHLAAPDVFVWHDGSVSFKGEAETRTLAAVGLLAERFPDYRARVDAWVQADPLLPTRARLDAWRLNAALQGRGLVLFVSHDRGGGTARHEEELAARLDRQGLAVLLLRPSARRPGALALQAPAFGELPNLAELPLAAEGLLAEVLALLPLRQIHLHHLADFPPATVSLLPQLAQRLGVPLDVTVHDYMMVCPRINLVDDSGLYCGEPTDAARCQRCLATDAAGRAAGDIGDWRLRHATLLRQARQISVPDVDVAQRLLRYLPDLPIQVHPHEPVPDVDPASWQRPRPVRRVLVAGALSPIKGLDVVRDLAASPAARAAGWQFTLLGHSSDDAGLRAAGVEVLGRYEDSELGARIEALDPDLILIPSVWPETYCYVLSAALASGRRVAVFDLGAQCRRLRSIGLDRYVLPLAEARSPQALVARITRAAQS